MRNDEIEELFRETWEDEEYNYILIDGSKITVRESFVLETKVKTRIYKPFSKNENF